MNVLLTGANGFVGSHILDCLAAHGLPTTVLLRASSNRRFIEPHLPRTEVRLGSISDPSSLDPALDGISHVVHCAGSTKALRNSDFHQVNQVGTRNLVEAVNRRPGQIQRLLHISSMAAAGPAVPDTPAREADPPKPVSEYGRSKLASEREVQERCRSESVILRPPGVYGPRDGEFLGLFKAVKAHIVPQFGGGRQALSLVFADDLAEVAVVCLTHPAAAGKTYFVASPDVTTLGALAEAIAKSMGVWTMPLPLPMAVLWPVCAVQEAVSRLTGKPSVLSRQKYPELTAPGWVCDASRLRADTGCVCATDLQAGLAETLRWYRENAWL